MAEANLTSEEAPLPSEKEHKRLARAGVVVIIGAIVCALLASAIAISHRARTHEITPGEKPAPALAFLDPTRA
ncbi:MAG TPA: hypothetical protein VKU90_10790 [Caulobacteraceae bacterium]|nr:hypothetical protein [Caulobacteraceae bacterium]